MNRNHVPDWKLERYVLGELPAEELENIAALERVDAGLRSRIAALQASDAEILAKYPPAWMARKTLLASAGASWGAGGAAPGGAGGRRWGAHGVMRWAVPTLACVTLLFLLPMRGMLPGGEADGDRVKGIAPGLEVWRKAGESAEKLAPEDAARAGDIVQLRYVVPEFCYGALVSVDGRGVLTVHLSGDSGRAAPLTPGKPVALATSYQLDDAPRFEAFYLITAADNFDVDSVTRRLRREDHPIDGKRMAALPQKQKITAAFTLRKFDGKGVN